MEKRPFGNTGINLSIIGFGGIIVDQVEQNEVNNLVSKAMDNGINYFDVSPNYGIAQDRLGPALEGKRKNIFLACKTEKRTKSESKKELEQSLKILKTDYVDLYQLHAVKKMEDVEIMLGENGALQTFIEAQKEGKIKYISFSVHTMDTALALLDRFQFTSILFPVNWVSYINNNFGNSIMQKAIEKGTARLALKAVAKNE